MMKHRKEPTQWSARTPRAIAHMNLGLMRGTTSAEQAAEFLEKCLDSWLGAAGPLRERKIAPHPNFVTENTLVERHQVMGYLGGLSVEQTNLSAKDLVGDPVEYDGPAIVATLFVDPERATQIAQVAVSLPTEYQHFKHHIWRASFVAVTAPPLTALE